ncbi:MAG: hypothetical protein Q8861_06590 [Bacteroidota bacterium]|jgi:hypothetical protein|nr:hypothetical protein [Bacteroidota bacterium]
MRKCFTILLLSFFLLSASHLAAQTTTYPDTQEQTQRIGVVVSEKKMTVFNAPYNTSLKVFSLVGVKVAEFKVTLTRQDFYLDLPIGYYIVKVGEQTFKIAIR